MSGDLSQFLLLVRSEVGFDIHDCDFGRNVHYSTLYRNAV
jgi:hypothetical protein